MPPVTPTLTRAETKLHGHRVSYRAGGREGAPLLLLVHGITNSSETWVPALPLLVSRPLLSVGGAIAGLLGRVGLTVRSDVAGIAAGMASLRDVEARRAFVHTARSVIDVGGQLVNATDRLYLAEALPTMLVWGARDPIIPHAHGLTAHELMPGSRLELFERSGHFPHQDDPIRFALLMQQFVEETEAAHLDAGILRDILLERERAYAAEAAAAA